LYTFVDLVAGVDEALQSCPWARSVRWREGILRLTGYVLASKPDENTQQEREQWKTVNGRPPTIISAPNMLPKASEDLLVDGRFHLVLTGESVRWARIGP
jgi:hypothetical protein